MNKLISELERLYFLPGQAPGGACNALLAGRPVALDLVSETGLVRTLVVAFEKGGDWESLSALFRAIQEDLDLPAPAVSVSGGAGFLLWLSLAEPVPEALAAEFVQALRARYLAALPDRRLRLYPGAAGPLSIVPAIDESTGRWSAFIDPTMGAMFVDEAGLDIEPNYDRQADILAGLSAIKPGDFQRALHQLKAAGTAHETESGTAARQAVATGQGSPEQLSIGGGFADPKLFLMAVMNDTTVSAAVRVEAAKALLPYCAPPAGSPEIG
jgi:hypothetical protein